MNKKETKVLRLWEEGMRSLPLLANRIGFTGNATTKGIAKVKQILDANGITDEISQH